MEEKLEEHSSTVRRMLHIMWKILRIRKRTEVLSSEYAAGRTCSTIAAVRSCMEAPDGKTLGIGALIHLAKLTTNMLIFAEFQLFDLRR